MRGVTRVNGSRRFCEGQGHVQVGPFVFNDCTDQGLICAVKVLPGHHAPVNHRRQAKELFDIPHGRLWGFLLKTGEADVILRSGVVASVDGNKLPASPSQDKKPVSSDMKRFGKKLRQDTHTKGGSHEYRKL